VAVVEVACAERRAVNETKRLLVALALGGFLAQLGRDEQAWDLRRGQLWGALALATDGKLVVG
jgi:hypothetical protein